MALANSIGSNIFEVLFCLGIPWMVENCRFWKEPGYYGRHDVRQYLSDHQFSHSSCTYQSQQLDH